MLPSNPIGWVHAAALIACFLWIRTVTGVVFSCDLTSGAEWGIFYRGTCKISPSQVEEEIVISTDYPPEPFLETACFCQRFYVESAPGVQVSVIGSAQHTFWSRITQLYMEKHFRLVDSRLYTMFPNVQLIWYPCVHHRTPDIAGLQYRNLTKVYQTSCASTQVLSAERVNTWLSSLNLKYVYLTGANFKHLPINFHQLTGKVGLQQIDIDQNPLACDEAVWRVGVSGHLDKYYKKNTFCDETLPILDWARIKGYLLEVCKKLEQGFGLENLGSYDRNTTSVSVDTSGLIAKINFLTSELTQVTSMVGLLSSTLSDLKDRVESLEV